MKCPHCNQDHPEGTKFCPETGKKMPTPKRCKWDDCPGDHRILCNDALFCPDCGRPLETTLPITVRGETFEMVYVEGGTFAMGSNHGYSDEKPVHDVTLSSFHIGRHLVTQALWRAVMGSNPSNTKGNELPVTNISWNDITNKFLPELNHLTGKQFRLPTEAEWEYAARGGSKSEGSLYSGSDDIEDVAWYDQNSHGIQPVGGKAPNELGIFDMSGNVLEWCHDWYGEYGDSPQKDPQGPSSGTYRVSRGGSYDRTTDECRVSFRLEWDPDFSDDGLGFRLAL